VPFGDGRNAAGELSFGKESRYIDHREQGIDGLVTLIGIRYTTARGDSAKALDLLLQQMPGPPGRAPTERVPLAGGDIADFSRLAAAAGLALVVLSLGFDATTLYRLHPDEYLFFNPLVGGLEGASRRYATDYWVNIMPEAVGDLERFLDHTERLSDKRRPRRPYQVLVCGERLPFEKEADDRLEWTRDWARADFFIAPTHMNCDRAVDGRVVATIERLGVVIGVVKDRRALIRPNLAQSMVSGRN